MTGQWKGYSRIRIGELRVIFEIDELTRTIYVDYLGPRGEIYKS
jgi:mRNA interferase RelE/StbE